MPAAPCAFSGGVNYTTAQSTAIVGSGPLGNGAIENISGSNTFNAPITLAGNATIGSDAGTLNLTNPTLTLAAGNLTTTGAGNIVIASALPTNGEPIGWVGFTAANPNGADSTQNLLDWTDTGGNTLIQYGGGFATSTLTYNGGAALNGSAIELTDGDGGETSSVWTPYQEDLGSFTTTFKWTYGANLQSEGFTFAFQEFSNTIIGEGAALWDTAASSVQALPPSSI